MFGPSHIAGECRRSNARREVATNNLRSQSWFHQVIELQLRRDQLHCFSIDQIPRPAQRTIRFSTATSTASCSLGEMDPSLAASVRQWWYCSSNAASQSHQVSVVVPERCIAVYLTSICHYGANGHVCARKPGASIVHLILNRGCDTSSLRSDFSECTRLVLVKFAKRPCRNAGQCLLCYVEHLDRRHHMCKLDGRA